MRKSKSGSINFNQFKGLALLSYLDQQVFLLNKLHRGLEQGQLDVIRVMNDIDESNLEIFKKYAESQNELFFHYNVLTGGAAEGGNNRETKGIKRFDVEVIESKLSESSSYSFPESGNVLVLGPCYEEVLEWINKKGLTPVQLTGKVKEEEFEALFKQNTAGVIGIAPQACTEMQALDFVQTLFMAAKHMAAAGFNRGNIPFFTAITCLGGRFGFSYDGGDYAVGSVSGLLKTIAREWENKAAVRYLDLSSDITADRAVAFMEEELAFGKEVEVGRGKNGERYIFALAENYEMETASSQPASKDVFLVTGGGRGITAACILELAKLYQCGFILMGRSELKDEGVEFADAETMQDIRNVLLKMHSQSREKKTPKELERIASDILARREIRNTLKAIESFGGRAAYYSCDVRNIEMVKTAVCEGSAYIGEVTGIIHGAGVLADKLIERKTEADFNNVFGIKYSGLNNALKCVNAEKLKYLVLFSSVAGCFGNTGQADYACANEYLNHFARYWKHIYPECLTAAINWGAWDAGMVEPALRRAMKERGVKLIPEDVGVQFFADVFRNKHKDEMCQIVVNYSDRWGA